jgi:hypothetical protein
MFHGLTLIVALAIMLASACQARSRTQNGTPPDPETPGQPPSPPAPPVPPGDVLTVTGSERIGWDHEVPSGTRGAVPTYAAYLDGIRVDLPGVSCTPRSDTLFDCSAPLPSMSLGLHSLRLSSFGPPDGHLQSPRSRALNLRKVEPGTVIPVQAAETGAAGGATFVIEVISDATGPIADIAVSDAGAVFVAEAAGRILINGHDGLVEALQIRDVSRRGATGLFSIALHPDFEKNHLVYFAYAAENAKGPVWRLARGREVNGRIGEVAILIDGEPTSTGSSSVIRFGPDRQLYAALGADSSAEARSGAYSGKLLRLTGDGARATNNADGSPIVDSVQGAPTGLTWVPDLRLLQSHSGERHELVFTQGDRTAGRYVWDTGRRPAALAFTPAGGGWLFIATLDRGLQRVRWPPPKGGVKPEGASLADEYTNVRAVTATLDGTVYFGTANPTADRVRRSGKNYVIRLRPR